MGLKEELLAIQTGELIDIVRADGAAYKANTGDAQHSAKWLAEQYPELSAFAKEVAANLGKTGLSETEQFHVYVGAALMASTLAKYAEVQALPSLEG